MLSSGNVGWAAAWGLTLMGVAVSGGPEATSLAARAPPPPATSEPDTSTDPPQTHDDPFTVVAPPEVSFGEVAVGTQVSETFRIRNEGDSGFEVLGLSIGGDGFILGSSDCVIGELLRPHDSCDIEVIFESQLTGDFPGTVAMSFEGDNSVSVALMASVSGPSSVSTTPPPATTTPSVTPTVPATSAPATTVPGNTEDEVAALRACNERASSAAVAYSPDLEMTVGVETEVAVFIGVDGAPPPTSSGTTPTPSTTIVPATLACFIELQLSGTGFEIETPVQSGDFTSTSTGAWFWDVTPERTGQLDLELRIVPKLSTPAGFQPGTPRPFRAAISVEAAPRTAWQQIGDATGGVVAHPFFQFALAAGLIGGVGSWAKRQLAAWRSRRDTVDDDDTGYL